MNFASRGENVTIYPLAKIISPETIRLGSNIIIDDFVFIGRHPSMSIGSYVHLGGHTLIAGGGDFKMGDFSSTSGGVLIYTGTEDGSGACLTNPTVPEPFRKPLRSFVHVGRHVLLGAGVVVLPGVTIGDGAIIGACTLVTKDLDPWTVYVGQPARPIKTRPKDAILAQEREVLAHSTICTPVSSLGS